MKRPLLLLPLLALAAAPCLAEMRNGILPTRRMESRQLTERECVKSPNFLDWMASRLIGSVA